MSIVLYVFLYLAVTLTHDPSRSSSSLVFEATQRCTNDGRGWPAGGRMLEEMPPLSLVEVKRSDMQNSGTPNTR